VKSKMWFRYGSIAIFASLLFLFFSFLRPIRVSAPEILVSGMGSTKVIEPDIRTSGGDKTPSVFSWKLTSENAASLLRIDSISYFVGTYGNTLSIKKGRLASPDRRCVFEIRNEQTFGDFSYLMLEKVRCDGPVGTELLLEIESDKPLALFANNEPMETSLNPKIISATHPNQKWWLNSIAVPMGHMDQSKDWNRLGLLAYIWEVDYRFAVAILSCALGLLAFGLMMCLRLAFLPGRRLSWFCAVTLVVFSFSTIFAISAPPFQGPDEADHFRTFLAHTGRGKLDSEALKFANQSHYKRLLSNPTQQLALSHVNDPMVANWPGHTSPLDLPSRSYIGARIWEVLSRFFPDTAAVATLHFVLRIFNSLFFAVTVGITATYVSQPLVLLGSLFWIPSILQFANHNSNYIFLISAYFVNAAFSWSLVNNAFLSRSAFIFLGTINCFSMLAGRFGLLGYFILAILIAIRIGRARVERAPFKESLLTVLLALVPTLVGITILNGEPYFHFVREGLMHFQAKAAVVLPSVGFGLGLVWLVLSRKFVQSFCSRCLSAPFVLVWKFVIVFSILLFLSLPLWLLHWPLPDIEFTSNYVSQGWFLQKVFLSIVKNHHPFWNDFFLIDSFWSGFGAPEIILPSWFISVLKCTPLACFCVYILMSLRKPLQEWLVPLFSLLFVVLVYLASVSYALGDARMNMQGRYLIGIYLVTTLTGYSIVSSLVKRDFMPIMQLCFLVVGVFVQASAVGFLLNRYFG
jgi:hypothetical protein